MATHVSSISVFKTTNAILKPVGMNFKYWIWRRVKLKIVICWPIRLELDQAESFLS
jgi:hypothetical protein